jgi:hypothetical protein
MFSQTGYDYLKRFPTLPEPKCITDTIELNIFNKALWKLTNELDSLCKLRKDNLEARIEQVKPNVEKNIAQEYGLSNTDLQKLKNKKLSKEEKKKIADQMMQNKANISMAEIEQLKKMKKEGNKEGIQNWADAYSTQKMAEMTSGDSTKTPEQIEMEKNLTKNKKLNDLMLEQKDLVDRIDAVNKRYTNKMIEFNKEDSIQTAKLDRMIKPLEKMLTEDNLSGDQRRGIEIEIATHRLNYCNKISPMYMDIIRDIRYSSEPLLPVYDRLEVVNAELNAATLGLNEWPTDPGLMQLEAVKGLAHTIASIFKYTIIPPSRDY